MMALHDELLSGNEVRLFPCHHISTDQEAELRATASLLAVARAVTEFGRAIVSIAGGPVGKLSCYTEVPFKVQTGATSREERPDGVFRVKKGKTGWTALVEVKVGDNSLKQDQFDCYHTLAGDQDIDALITISNQSALANGLPPELTFNSFRLRKVPVFHLSWERLLSEAQLLRRDNRVADADQQWMLEEWIRYVADPQSRIIEPPQMGEHWNKVLLFAHEGNLGACKSELLDVVQRWDAFLRKVALRLRARLGAGVKLKTSKPEQNDYGKYIKNLHDAAIKKGELSGVLRIPDAAGDLSVVVLLAARSVQYSIEVKAPMEGKAITRIKWMLRQLNSEDVPGDLVFQIDWGWGLCSQAQIGDLKKEGVDRLLWDNNGQSLSKASPRSFSLKWTIGLRKGKARSTAPVLEGIDRGVEDFYRSVVEGLRPYVRKVPQLPKEEPRKEESKDDDSTKQQENDPEAPTTEKPVTESEESHS